MNHSKWQAIGILTSVFVLGGIAGIGSLMAWQSQGRRVGGAHIAWGPRGERPMLAMMRRLDLSSEQQRAIEAALERHAPRRNAIMQDMMHRCGKEMDQEKAELDDEIRGILSEPQRLRFDELSRRQRERMFGQHGLPAQPHR